MTRIQKTVFILVALIALVVGLVLGVGPEGRNATLENALAGAAVFDLGRDEAEALIAEMRAVVAARWEPLFEAAGLGQADRGRFATCFRLAGNHG